MKKDTQCVHSGTYVDLETKGINTPIFTSSSFEYLDIPENVYPPGISIRPIRKRSSINYVPWKTQKTV